MAIEELFFRAEPISATSRELIEVAAAQLETASRIINDTLFIARLEVR